MEAAHATRRFQRGLERVRRLPAVVWLILLGALAIRVAFVALTPDYAPTNDAATYDLHANEIIAGQGYPESTVVAEGGPTAFTTPGYPLFLAAIYSVAGESSWTAGRLAQALLGTVIVILTGVIAFQLWGRRFALWCMAAGALAPPLIVPTVTLLSEPLFMVFTLAALAAALQQRRSARGWPWTALAGLLTGLAVLTRPTGIVILLPLAVALWPDFPRVSARTLRQPAILVCVTALAISPWVIRNAIATDEFVPLSTRLGYALQRTYNDAARDHPRYPSTPRSSAETLAIFHEPGIEEVEAARRLQQAGLDYMREHPDYVLVTLGRNVLRALHLQDLDIGRGSVYLGAGEGLRPWLGDFAIYGFYAMALLALFGAFKRSIWWRPTFVWAIPLLLLLATIWMADGRVRYRTPSDPFVVLIAGMGLAALSQRFSPRRRHVDQPRPS